MKAKLLKLLCYVCGKNTGKEVVMASERDATDRPFPVHPDCARCLTEDCHLVTLNRPDKVRELLQRAVGFVRDCAEEGMFDTAYQLKAAECLTQIERRIGKRKTKGS